MTIGVAAGDFSLFREGKWPDHQRVPGYQVSGPVPGTSEVMKVISEKDNISNLNNPANIARNRWMDKIRNPFVPGAGSSPPELVGREAILEDARVAFARVKRGVHSRSFLLVGLRGVGKTVLLVRLQELAEQQGYRVVSIEAPENKRLPAILVPQLRKLLFELDRTQNVNMRVKQALGVLRSFINGFKVKISDIEFGLNIDPATGVADSGDLETDLPELLLAVAEAAQSRGIPVAITIDEMQYLTETELSALIMSVHKIDQKRLPLFLIGAGLPQLVGLCGKSKSYAERLFDFPTVGPLKAFDAKNALQIPVRKEDVNFEAAALDEIIRVTQGYPYFLQEWGYQSWNIATRSPITLGIVKSAYHAVLARLDSSFFRVRFDRLTPREKDYLRAMAELGPNPHRSGEVADLLGVEVRSVAPLRSNLIKKGMIYSPAHGDTAFTVPLFDQFMKRTMPEMRRRKSSKRDSVPE